MELIAIKDSIEENSQFVQNPDCQESLYPSIDYYKVIGYQPPWICYFVQKDNHIVGSAAFKGAPVAGRVEIAYGTFDKHRKRGVGTEICKKLVALAVQTDPLVEITARTLPEHNFSTKILEKNGFELQGTVIDKEDGPVWEWKYNKSTDAKHVQG